MFEIGILFDIDDLGGGSYGWKAYKILFNNLDPHKLTGCSLHDGDTSETLQEEVRIYCIAIQTVDESKIEYIRETFRKCNDKGLLSPDQRFLESSVTDEEPLVLAGYIDLAGNLVVDAYSMIGEGWTKGTKWTLKRKK